MVNASQRTPVQVCSYTDLTLRLSLVPGKDLSFTTQHDRENASVWCNLSRYTHTSLSINHLGTGMTIEHMDYIERCMKKSEES